MCDFKNSTFLNCTPGEDLFKTIFITKTININTIATIIIKMIVTEEDSSTDCCSLLEIGLSTRGVVIVNRVCSEDGDRIFVGFLIPSGISKLVLEGSTGVLVRASN